MFVISFKEWNSLTFEDRESSLDHLKDLFTLTLLDWSRIWGFIDCSSIFKF